MNSLANSIQNEISKNTVQKILKLSINNRRNFYNFSLGNKNSSRNINILNSNSSIQKDVKSSLLINESLIKKTEKCYSSQPSATNTNKDKKRKKVNLNTLNNLYRKKEPIVMITAHDYPSGLFAENGKADMCLVGDSLGMVTLGYDSTNPVTMEDMISHCRAVSRGSKSAFLVCDMPFGSYEVSAEEAVRNSVRLIAEGNAEAVKLEGGKEMAQTIKSITKVGIPVIGHIGLTPQRQSSLGGFRVQGKTLGQVQELLEDALALQEAGCSGIVLEAMPEKVATFITSQLKVFTIGIGAGPGCSGQVLVQQDMLGSFDKFVPKFCKVYANVSNIATEAVRNYCKDVKERTFPDINKHCYKMKAEEEAKLEKYIKEFTKSK